MYTSELPIIILTHSFPFMFPHNLWIHYANYFDFYHVHYNPLILFFQFWQRCFTYIFCLHSSKLKYLLYFFAICKILVKNSSSEQTFLQGFLLCDWRTHFKRKCCVILINLYVNSRRVLYGTVFSLQVLYSFLHILKHLQYNNLF